MTDPGESLAVQVFRGNTADPKTVATQIDILTQQFAVQEVVFVGDRGMAKSTGKTDFNGRLPLHQRFDRSTNRKLLSEQVIQMELFTEQVCEVEADQRRFILHKNPEEARRAQLRLQDKLAQLRQKISERNQQVETSPRSTEAGLQTLTQWIWRYKLDGFADLKLEGRQLVETVKPQAEQRPWIWPAVMSSSPTLSKRHLPRMRFTIATWHCRKSSAISAP